MSDARLLVQAGLSRNDLEPPHASGLVDAEVAPIDGEDSVDALAFGESNERGIGEIHWKVAILAHEMAHARAIVAIEVGDSQHFALEHLPQRVLGLHGATQKYMASVKTGQAVSIGSRIAVTATTQS